MKLNDLIKKLFDDSIKNNNKRNFIDDIEDHEWINQSIYTLLDEENIEKKLNNNNNNCLPILNRNGSFKRGEKDILYEKSIYDKLFNDWEIMNNNIKNNIHLNGIKTSYDDIEHDIDRARIELISRELQIPNISSNITKNRSRTRSIDSSGVSSSTTQVVSNENNEITLENQDLIRTKNPSNDFSNLFYSIFDKNIISEAIINLPKPSAMKEESLLYQMPSEILKSKILLEREKAMIIALYLSITRKINFYSLSNSSDFFFKLFKDIENYIKISNEIKNEIKNEDVDEENDGYEDASVGEVSNSFIGPHYVDNSTLNDSKNIEKVGFLFNNISLKLHLILLQSFQETNKKLFFIGLEEILKIVQSFPILSLNLNEYSSKDKNEYENTDNNSNNNINDSMFDSISNFCCKLLNTKEIESKTYLYLLNILLSFGLRSGKIRYFLLIIKYLLETPDKLLSNILFSQKNDLIIKKKLKNNIENLENIKIKYHLSIFEIRNHITSFQIPIEDYLSLNNISMKELGINVSETNHFRFIGFNCDGKYLYTWDSKYGLLKVGSGLRNTISGKTYDIIDSKQIINTFRETLDIIAGYYGNAVTVTTFLQNYIKNNSYNENTGVLSTKRFLDIYQDPSSFTSSVRLFPSSLNPSEAHSEQEENRNIDNNEQIINKLKLFMSNKNKDENSLLIEFEYNGVIGSCYYKNDEPLIIPKKDWYKNIDVNSKKNDISDKNDHKGKVKILFALYGKLVSITNNLQELIRNTENNNKNCINNTINKTILAGNLLSDVPIDITNGIIYIREAKNYDSSMIQTLEYHLDEEIDLYENNVELIGCDMISMPTNNNEMDTNILICAHRKYRRKDRNHTLRFIQVDTSKMEIIKCNIDINLYKNYQNGNIHYNLYPDLIVSGTVDHLVFILYFIHDNITTNKYNIYIRNFSTTMSWKETNTFTIQLQMCKEYDKIHDIIELWKMERGNGSSTNYINKNSIICAYTNGLCLGICFYNDLIKINIIFDMEKNQIIEEIIEENDKNTVLSSTKEYRSIIYDFKNNLLWSMDANTTGQYITMNKNLGYPRLLYNQNEFTYFINKENVINETNYIFQIFDLIQRFSIIYLPENNNGYLDLPCPNVDELTLLPFSIEFKYQTFHVLMDIALYTHSKISLNSKNNVEVLEINSLILLNTLRCLLVNLRYFIIIFQKENNKYLRKKHDIKKICILLNNKLLPFIKDIISNVSIFHHLLSNKNLSHFSDTFISINLNLFIQGLDIFYPSYDLQIKLAIEYLNKSISNTLSHIEHKILTMILKRFSLLNNTKILIEKNIISNASINNIYHIFKELLDISIKDSINKIDIKRNIVLNNNKNNTKEIIESIDNKQILRHNPEDIIILLDSMLKVLFQSNFITSESSNHMIEELIIKIFNDLVYHSNHLLIYIHTISNIQNNDKHLLIVEYNNILKESIVGVLLSFFFSSMLLIIDVKSFIFNDIYKTKDILLESIKLIKSINDFIHNMDTKDKYLFVNSTSIISKKLVYESIHNYQNNMDEIKEIRVPGASQLTITFDPRTRTEPIYDYITFFKDEKRNEYYGEEKYSGREEESNWPGLQNNPSPLIIPSDHFYLYFHSDGSSVDWGWKLVVTAKVNTFIKAKKTHWLVHTKKSIINYINKIITLTIQGSEIYTDLRNDSNIKDIDDLYELEKSYINVLENKLLHGGYYLKKDIHENDPFSVSILKEFIDPMEGSSSEKVLHLLKTKTSQDQGSVPYINRAIRAVGAAIIHHTMASIDMYALAQNEIKEPTTEILKAWKNAQKMRNWLDVGDAAGVSSNAENKNLAQTKLSHINKTLRRQPSAYKGATEEAQQTLCSKVVERAIFLLSLTPASFSFVHGAKQHWGLLAKYGNTIHLGRNNNHDTILMDKWYNLIKELKEATELREILKYRKTVCERTSGFQERTITELILEFVQSDIDIKELELLINIRNKRAKQRLTGIELLYLSLEVNKEIKDDDESCILLLDSFITSIHQICEQKWFYNKKLHFLNGINGCEAELSKNITEMYGKCLKLFSHMIQHYRNNNNNPTSLVNESILVYLIKCSIMDYDENEAFLLNESNIIDEITSLLINISEKISTSKLSRVAFTMFRIYLSIFFSSNSSTYNLSLLNNKDMNTSDITTLQKHLIHSIGNLLQYKKNKITNIIIKSNSFFPHIIELRKDTPGPCMNRKKFSNTSNQLNIGISFSFWIFVPLPEYNFFLKIGDNVKRGPHYKKNINTNDKIEHDDIGLITSIDYDLKKVSIKWISNGTTENCIWDVENKIYEILPCKDSIDGSIFFIGNKNLNKENIENVEMDYFGCILNSLLEINVILPNKRKIINSTENDFIVYNSENNMPFNKWTHIGITMNENTLSFFMDGDLIDIKSIYLDSSDSITKFLNNNSTIYFGQPPAYVFDSRAGASFIHNYQMIPHYVPNNEMKCLKDEYSNQYINQMEPLSFPKDEMLQILVLVTGCTKSSFGQSIFSSNKENIANLLFLAFHEHCPIDIRCSSITLLNNIITFTPKEIIEIEFFNIIQIDSENKNKNLVSYVFYMISQSINIWNSHKDLDEIKIKNIKHFSYLREAFISFLRYLCALEDWFSDISEYIFSSMDRLSNLLDHYKDKKSIDIHDKKKDWDHLLATIAFLGGTYTEITIGSRVKCCVEIDGKETNEMGIVIQLSVRGNGENIVQVARVLLDCNMNNIVDIPLIDVSPIIGSNMYDPSISLENIFQKLFLLNNTNTIHIISILKKLLTFDISIIENILYKPKLIYHNITKIIESDHPYGIHYDRIYPIDIPNAIKIEILVDPMTSIGSSPLTYIQFIKKEKDQANDNLNIDDNMDKDTSNNDTIEFWGKDKYYSNDLLQEFGKNDPLIILPTSCVDIHFHTDSSETETDWGFKFIVNATIEKYEDIPEYPPTIVLNALSDLKSRVLKMICLLFRQRKNNKEMISFYPLIKEISSVALSSCHGKPLYPIPKKQIFESKHPYANSISEYMTVVFKGASRMRISFDDMSRTETGCDYIVFFKDKSLNERWGENQYTGKGGTENWPGFGGRDVLEIPADNFTLFWCTDASNVDWGWKFVVTAEFPSILPIQCTLDQLDQRAQCITEILYENPMYQEIPSPSIYEGYEKEEIMNEINELNNNDTIHTNVNEKIYSIIKYSIHDDYNNFIKKITNTNIHNLISNKTNQMDILLSENDFKESLFEQNNDYENDKNTNKEDMMRQEENLMGGQSPHFILQDLKGQLKRIYSLYHDTTNALSIKYANKCIQTILLHPNNMFYTLKPYHFGKSKDLLLLLLKLYTNEKNNEKKLKKNKHLLMERMIQFLTINDNQKIVIQDNNNKEKDMLQDQMILYCYEYFIKYLNIKYNNKLFIMGQNIDNYKEPLDETCFVLDILIKYTNSNFKIFSPEMIYLFIKSLIEMPISTKIKILHILFNLVSDKKYISNFIQLPNDSIESFNINTIELIIRLKDLLKQQTAIQYKKEVESQHKSPYLQSLIQCCVSLDLTLNDFNVENSIVDNKENKWYDKIIKSIKIMKEFKCNTTIIQFDNDTNRSTLSSLHQNDRLLQYKIDKQIVLYVNYMVKKKNILSETLLQITWSELEPSSADLIKWPLLAHIITMDDKINKEKVHLSQSNNDKKLHECKVYPIGQLKNTLNERFMLLQSLNRSVFRILPLIDLSLVGNKWSYATLLSELRDLIFTCLKERIWNETLKLTETSGSIHEVSLSRQKASRHKLKGQMDYEARYTLFGQAFRQLYNIEISNYRRSNKLYHVHFIGENSQDAGGPYRDTLAQFCTELQSNQLDLLLRTSNSLHNVGICREKWVFNPSARTATHFKLYEFLGRLMGVAIRNRECLSLNLASIIWKELVNDIINIDDLEAIDSMLVRSMNKMRTIDTLGVTEEMFQDVVMEDFTTISADNKFIELKENGKNIPVTYHNRCEYATLVENYKLHEYDIQIQAVKKGLNQVVPCKLLTLFTAYELEDMICGSPEIDILLLKQATEYSGCKEMDFHIQCFWDVLHMLTHQERSDFLRFTWGRSRLPSSLNDFPQLFKLQSFNKYPPDKYLPVAHTCFFALELPAYSSIEILKEKLLYAIYNCQAIDADGDSILANQLGWEED